MFVVILIRKQTSARVDELIGEQFVFWNCCTKYWWPQLNNYNNTIHKFFEGISGTSRDHQKQIGRYCYLLCCHTTTIGCIILTCNSKMIQWCTILCLLLTHINGPLLWAKKPISGELCWCWNHCATQQITQGSIWVHISITCMAISRWKYIARSCAVCLYT